MTECRLNSEINLAHQAVFKDFHGGLKDWLEAKAVEYGFNWLLLHADDGVIWGYYDRQAAALKLSGEVFAETRVTLRQSTLQQARLFGPQGELFVWKAAEGFLSRLILGEETPLPGQDSFDEVHLLWGEAVKTRDNFTLMVEGAEKHYHTLPLTLKKGSRAGLQVRHYLNYDSTGQAYTACSRLLGLVEVEGGKE